VGAHGDHGIVLKTKTKSPAHGEKSNRAFLQPLASSANAMSIDDPANAAPDLPIDGVLDLHTFRPEDTGDLIRDYLAACRERGILEVRIIHGKGVGNLRRGVHALLPRVPGVISFASATPLFGGEGATIVRLRPLES
jgi:dsDNA-specific endonuclease/ATPase MutS2